MLGKAVRDLIEHFGGGEEEAALVELISQKLEVGEKVYALRAAMGVNESDFAAMLGLSTAEVDSILNGDFEADAQTTLTKILEAVENYKNDN
jgi:DNA-binding transcriptional regulator YiaG